jgi:translation initiation factor 4G
VAEKTVKSILNKMTKEKFARLAQQMIEIPVTSYAILTMMIENIFDKAIDEPSFGEIYADLCVQLSQSLVGQNFVHIIESDEEPPTESGDSTGVGESSHNTVYRWSNDVSTTDAEIVGPFASIDECIQTAVEREDASPVERGDMELDLERVLIKEGMFIKVLKRKDSTPEEQQFYAVYFDVSDAKECGQQLSEIHLSQVEAVSDANKKNSFKRSLLNKCEEEFNKQDIYVDWKKEKQEYEESKASMTDAERAEKEEELDFRRIRIKKQMLGNIKFIGQLFKKNMLKERIMRYCIATLLKLDEPEKGKYVDKGNADMDEEDHEAICSMFGTIGATIDKPASADFMKVCFDKIQKLSTDSALPSRSRFMYKDLLELRQNQWVPRRKVEKAKTLEEIRKDVEREERRQAQQSQQAMRGSFRQSGTSGGRGSYDNRNQRQPINQGNRPRQPKPSSETDADGFTTIGNSRPAPPPPKGNRGSVNSPRILTKSAFSALADDSANVASTSKSTPEPLSEDKLKRRVKSMRADFIGDGGNVDELLLSMDELSGTPDAGTILVQSSADSMMDCKDEEREAIVKIIFILAEKGKISSQEVKKGLLDTIEFIDSFAMDAPRAFEYTGELLAPLLTIGTVDIEWICMQAETTKADPDTKAPFRIVGETLKALAKRIGADAAVKKFNASESSLVQLLGGNDKWSSIQTQYIA